MPEKKMPTGENEVWNFWKTFSDNIDSQFEKMVEESVENYKKGYEMWNDYREKFAEQLRDFSEEGTQESKVDIFQDWMTQAQDYYDMLEEFGWTTGQEEFMEMYQEYMDKMEDTMLKSMFKNLAEEQKDLYELWMDQFTPSEERQEEIKELTTDLTKVYLDSMKNFTDIFMKSYEEGGERDMFNKIQQEWLKSASKFYGIVLESSPFAKQMGMNVQRFLEDEELRQDMIENFLKMNSLPTRSDIVSVYEALHELTTRIRKMERKLDSMSKAE